MKLFKKEPKVQIGRDRNFPFFKNYLTEKEMNHHVHIVGASGFGKTVLISHILKSKINSKSGVMFIDQKGDKETIDQLTSYVREAGRLSDLKVFSLTRHDCGASYNLLNNGSANELRDRIMGSLNWSEEFYKNQASSFLLNLLIGLSFLRKNEDLKIDLHLIHKLTLDAKSISELAQKIPIDKSFEKFCLEEAMRFLMNQDSFKSLQGLRTQLQSICYSDYRDLVKDHESGIDLFKSVNEGKIVFIFLDTRRFGTTARAIGRFIVQDLKSVSARIDSEVPLIARKSFSVIVDEFADLADEEFVGFLDRARSSKIGIVIAHQEISDLDRISPQFAARLMGNTATLFAFLQKRPESAELISGIAGTKKVWKETKATEKFLGIEIDSGKRSTREVEEFRIHPNTIKSLGVGECVVVRKYPRASAGRVKVRRSED
jgi:conjugal transfer pilus assembly protein TraD